MGETYESEPKLKTTTILGETLTLLERLSKFAYYDDITFQLSETSKMLSHDEIEKSVLLGGIVPSDYFVLKVLAEFSWANSEMVTRAITRLHRIDPGKAYPEAKVEIIKSRLVRLCKSSLARGFKYLTQEGKTIQVYCATESGIYLLKKKLFYDGTVEVFNSLQSPEEAFKRLATNFVAQRLSYSSKMKTFQPGCWVYEKEVGKNFIYSHLKSEDDGILHNILVEPFYIKSNRLILSMHDMMIWNRKRIELIRFQISKYQNTSNFALVYVVEDKEGLKKALEFVVNELSDLYENIYFTSENAVYMSKNLSNAFVKITNIKEGVPSISACARLDFF